MEWLTGNNKSHLPLLHSIALISDALDCQTEIEKGRDIRAKGGENQVTVMHCAAMNKHHGAEIVRLFLSHGLPAKVKDSQGKKPIDYALKEKNFETAVELFKHQGYHCSLFHFCIRRGFLDAAKALHGTPDEFDKCGKTALHVAAESSDPRLCLWLLYSGSDAKILSKDSNNTVLHYAALNKEYARDLIGVFAPLGLDIDSKNTHGETPLHVALKEENFQAAEALLKLGANLFAMKGNMNVFLYCVKANKLTSAKFVYEKDRTLIQCPDFQGRRALHLGALFASREMCLWLISLGLDADATDVEDRTVMHCVARRLHPSVKLVHCFASVVKNIDKADALNMTPLLYAITCKNYDVARELIKLGADLRVKIGQVSALHQFIYNNLHEAVEFVLKNDPEQIGQHGAMGESLLQHAAKTSDVKMCKLLVELGCDVFYLPPNRLTPLHYAVCNQKHAKEVVEYLLQTFKNLAVNGRDDKGETPLHFALRSANLEVAQLLLDHGADIHVKRGEQNMLHYCVIHDKFESAKFLHKLDDDLMAVRELYGKSVLHVAAQYAGVNLCRWLVYHGADVQAVDEDRQATALFHVALRGEGRRELVQFFHSTGLNLALRDKHRYTALHFALSLGVIDMADELLACDGDLRTSLKDFSNVLQFCVSINNLEAVKYVLGKDKSLLREGMLCRRTLLHLAAQDADLDMCSYLVSQGADALALDSLKCNMLHYVARNTTAKLDLVEYFISLSVDVDQANDKGETPLHIALLRMNLPAAEHLIKKGALRSKHETNYLHFCVANNRLRSAVFVHEQDGSLINKLDSEGRNAQHIAAERADRSMVTWLGEKGVDLRLVSTTKLYNVMHYAAMNKEHGQELVRIFESLGVPLDAKACFDETPLHVAVDYENFDVAHALIDRGANLGIAIGGRTNLLHYCVLKNNLQGAQFVHAKRPQLVAKLATDGRNALHLAASLGDLDLCQWLVDVGVDPHAKTDGGLTVMDYCKGRSDVRKFFESLGVRKNGNFVQLVRRSFRGKGRRNL